MTPSGPSRTPVPDRAFRLGAAAAGLFTGAAIGILLWWGLVHFGLAARALPAFAFGGVAAGGVTGALFPDVGMSLAEGTLHLLLGMATSDPTLGEDRLESRHPAGYAWLAAASTFGVLYAFVLGFFA